MRSDAGVYGGVMTSNGGFVTHPPSTRASFYGEPPDFRDAGICAGTCDVFQKSRCIWFCRGANSRSGARAGGGVRHVSTRGTLSQTVSRTRGVSLPSVSRRFSASPVDIAMRDSRKRTKGVLSGRCVLRRGCSTRGFAHSIKSMTYRIYQESGGSLAQNLRNHRVEGVDKAGGHLHNCKFSAEGCPSG